MKISTTLRTTTFITLFQSLYRGTVWYLRVRLGSTCVQPLRAHMLQFYVSHPAFCGSLIQTRGTDRGCSSGDGWASISHSSEVPHETAYLRLSLRCPQEHGDSPAHPVTGKAYKKSNSYSNYVLREGLLLRTNRCALVVSILRILCGRPAILQPAARPNFHKTDLASKSIFAE